MHTTIGADGEVTPNVRCGLESNSLNATRGGLETLIRVFGCDTGRNQMTLGQGVFILHEVNFRIRIRIKSIKSSDVWNSIERNAHRNLELCCRQVHVGDSLSHRMLDLKSRIQLKEVILSRVGIVQVLNSTSANVTDVLRQSLSSLFHFSEDLGVGNSRRAFLKNLLKAALSGTVASTEGDCVSVLIADDLDFKMPGLSTELHHEHWRARNLSLDHLKVHTELIVVRAHANSLSTAAL